MSNSSCSDSAPPGEGRQRLVLFVCTGNLCRSPMAEYLFRKYLGPDSTWQAASAGLSAVEGAPASTQAIELLREKGVDLRPHRSRGVTKEMVKTADLIVVMTASHAREMKSRFPSALEKVFILKSFDTRALGDIEDPIGLSESAYRKTREEIGEALLDLIMYLRSR